MGRFRRTLVVTFSAAALIAVVSGVFLALRSPLFQTRVVEVADQPENAPLDAQAITRLAAVPDGVNLFDLDLKAVEKRILADSWIREVRLTKRFPQTLSISVSFREPKAIVQGEQGSLSYIDSDGTVFGQVNLSYRPDLPMLSGLAKGGTAQLKGALKILAAWDASSVGKLAQISSMSWDQDHGYRVLAVYSGKEKLRFRTMIDLGQEFDAPAEGQLARLEQVFAYLTNHSIPAKQIWADAGKKIVVKTAHGS